MKLDLQASIFSFLSFDKAGGGEDVVEGTFMQTLPAKKTKPDKIESKPQRQDKVGGRGLIVVKPPSFLTF